jgi:hypothetical protein
VALTSRARCRSEEMDKNDGNEAIQHRLDLHATAAVG